MSTEIQRTNPTAMTPMDLLQVAIEKEGSIDVIERLAKLQFDMLDREDRIKFRQAMTQFKAEMPKVIRSRSVPGKDGNERYKVVALEDVADPVMKTLLKHHITYRYKSDYLPDGKIKVTCFLALEGTAYEEQGATLAAPPDTSGGKDALKAVGSTTSYLEKYTLMASVGMHVYGSDPEAVIPDHPEEGMDEGTALDCIASIESAASEDEVWDRYIECLRTAGVPDNILADLNAGKPVNVVDSAKYPKEAKTFVEAKNNQLKKVKKQQVRR